MILFLLFFTLLNLSTRCADNYLKRFDDHYEILENTYLETIKNYLNPPPLKNEKQAHPFEIKQKTNPFALIARDIQYHKNARKSQYYRQIATWLIPAIALLQDQSIDLAHKQFFYAHIPQDLKDKVYKEKTIKNPTFFYNQIAYALKMNIIHNLRLVLDNNPELKNPDALPDLTNKTSQSVFDINITQTILLCAQFDCVSKKIPIPEEKLIPKIARNFEKKITYEKKLNKKNISQLLKIYFKKRKKAQKSQLKKSQLIRHLKNRLRIIAWKIIMLPLQPLICFNTQLNKITDWLFDTLFSE